MGTSKIVFLRAAKRVASSSAGEITGRSINLVLPFAMLTIHDANSITDGFFLAMAIAFLAQGTATNTLITALVPEIVKTNTQYNLSSYLKYVAVIGILLGLFTTFFSTTSQLSHEKITIALAVFIMATSGLIAAPSIAKLNSDHVYGISGLTWGLRIFPVTVYVLCAPETPALHILLLGISIFDLMRTIILCWITRKYFKLSSPNMVKLPFPVSAKFLIIASIITSFIPLIVRSVASLGSEGDVSIFELSDRLYTVIASLASIGFGNVTLVYLSRLSNTSEEEKGWKMIVNVSLAWSFLWLSIGIFFWFCFPEIAGYINFKSNQITSLVQNTLLALILGIPGFIFTGVLSRRLITLSKSRDLVSISLINLIFICASSYLLYMLYGVLGLGIALSASQYLVVLLMCYKLRYTANY